MPNRLEPLNVFDFTGGLNLRPDTFQLSGNEISDVLNMEPDDRGGLQVRKGWDYWGTSPITADPWNPRNAFLHVTSDNNHRVLVVNNNKLISGRSGVFGVVAGVTTGAKPHGADFVGWNDYVRMACGRNQPGIRYDALNNTATACVVSGGANWQNDYGVPGSTLNQPQAEVIAQHAGYLFVANTRENAVNYPTRVRWSHPNNPNAWALNDFIDIQEGGDNITAMIPFADRLLIFKQDSVWALFGYDAETWEFTNVSRNIGCIHQQAVARSEGACFFVSWPQGIFAYTERSGVQEISQNIRPLFIDNQLSYAGTQNIWLGWVNRRLWCSLPWLPDAVSTTATTAFVMDPEVGQGAWTKFRGADKCVPGPYMERPLGSDLPMLAFCRVAAHAFMLEAREDASDVVHDTVTGFDSFVRTAWMDAGAPTWKKSWRRPDFLLRGIQNPTDISITVFHNFDHLNPARQYRVQFSPVSEQAMWGQFVWGDGTKWGKGTQTGSPERGSTMGRAGALQVLATGTPGKPWGLNGIVFKYVPRRFR